MLHSPLSGGGRTQSLSEQRVVDLASGHFARPVNSCVKPRTAPTPPLKTQTKARPASAILVTANCTANTCTTQHRHTHTAHRAGKRSPRSPRYRPRQETPGWTVRIISRWRSMHRSICDKRQATTTSPPGAYPQALEATKFGSHICACLDLAIVIVVSMARIVDAIGASQWMRSNVSRCR